MTSKNHSRTHSLLVVLPVFGSVELAVECLRSLRSDVTGASDLVLVVNDQSPDSDHVDSVLRSELSTYPDAFRLVTNPVNRGLVETLNGAISSVEVGNFDVLLINSDVQITPGAVSEMRRILRADGTTGIVCPRSDNASLASIPHLAGYSREEAVHEFSRWCTTQPESITAPVAVGFCMVIRGELFPRFGLFDTAFSPGYGEENDFSMRIRRGGWRVALANRALAYHVGGVSFGRARASVLQLRNEIIFRRRYPRYTFDREMFLHNDNEGNHGSSQRWNPHVFGVAVLKQIVFTVLGVAPQLAAQLVLASRRIDKRSTR